jgi:hypothetical protein
MAGEGRWKMRAGWANHIERQRRTRKVKEQRHHTTRRKESNFFSANLIQRIV